MTLENQPISQKSITEGKLREPAQVLPVQYATHPAPMPPRRRRTRREKFTITKAGIYLLLISYLIIVIYPMLWLLYTSLKPSAEIFLNPFALPRPYDPVTESGGIRWDNFSRAWYGGGFGQYFLNSVIITSTTVVATTFLAAMTAYAISRFVFTGAKPILFYFLAGLMIPLQLAIVPLFFQLKQFDLLNSREGLFLVYLAFGFPFSIFILTGFFRTLPASLHESALLDGASEFGAFWHVMLPLARPGLITVGIFLFLGNWNEFLVAYMTLSGAGSEHIRTLPLGLANITIVAQYRADWGVAFAGLVLMMLPTLVAYVFLQKHLTKGITAGAVKG